ncbi:hypothetical protein [Sphingobacterium spiritivorum]|uniref:hypothetical protein n=1 Tax=Sphingobacterium spiritivorum TaxID=258 RepID=UPI003DA244C1
MKIQIDVKGHIQDDPVVIECNLLVDGSSNKIYMSSNVYQRLIDNGFFLRTGIEIDSAGISNTTELFTSNN